MILKFFRKKRNIRIILWIVTILIIPGFFIWGIGIETRKETTFAAIVNREPITLREFYNQLWSVEERYREIFGENYSQIRDKLNIEKNVLESMIREKLLLQQARKRRIKVFKNEIVEVVKSDPVFKNEKGEFDQQKFKQIMANYSDEELKKLENNLRKQLLLQKLKDQVVSETDITVTETEVEEYIKHASSPEVDKENIRRMLLWQKREKYFEDWYKNLRDNSKIIIYLKIKNGGN